MLKWEKKRNKKKQFLNFKIMSMDEKAAAAHCAEKSFCLGRNASAAGFSQSSHIDCC